MTAPQDLTQNRFVCAGHECDEVHSTRKAGADYQRIEIALVIANKNSRPNVGH